MDNVNREELMKKDTNEIIKILNANIEKGLSEKEVEERRKIYGYNEVEEKRESNIKKFLKKFWGIVAWIMEAAAILSFILKEYTDFYIIIGLIIFNAILSYAEEEKANKALELLKQKLQVEARVLRDGEWKLLPARELVPGDIVRVRLGDFVPADIKIIDGTVEVDQSMITGESLTVTKSKNDIIFSGSIIRRGEATGIVILTGKNTYFGKTVELVKIAKARLRVENVISRISFLLLFVVIIAISSVFIYLYLVHQNVLYFLPFSLILLIGAIPVAIPTLFTVSFSLGSMDLVKKGVLITKLNSIEAAATMNILFADKTGTITLNQLSVNKIFPLENYSEKDVILYGRLASREEDQDPIDLAFIRKANEINIDISNIKVLEFRPFDPSLRRTEADITINDKKITVSKGSVETLAKLANIDANKLYSIVQDELNKGNRVLAVAIKDKEWKIIGLVTLRDPPRPDSKDLIKELNNLGVRVVMLTGDALPIAKQIAEEVGIGSNIVTIKELKDIRNIDGVAEIYPEDKYNIVKKAQEEGFVAGMTGDGVNDAPALRQADVGIAVYNSTDVAKAAAAAVLTEPGLKNIVDLVKIGRSIIERIKVWIRNRVSRSLFEVIFISLGFILFGKYIINAFQIALMVFLYDFVTISISTDKILWSEKPEVWNIKEQLYMAILISILLISGGLLTYYIFLNKLNLEVSQTLTFDYILFANLYSLLNVREKRNFWASKPSKTLLLAIILDTILAILLSWIGIPGMNSAPIQYILLMLADALFFALISNNFIKIAAEKIIKI